MKYNKLVRDKRNILFAAGTVILGAVLAFGQNNPSGRPIIIPNIPHDYSVKAEYGQAIKVARVIDGDTIELINGDHLRYIGIDTPEEVKPDTPVQCFAREAAEKNKELVEGKDITFYKDVSYHDKYGRWLGFVYLSDGTFVNKELVSKGYAFAYPYTPDISKKSEFQAAEQSARQNNLGLWADCLVAKLKGGREQTNTVQ